MTDDEDVRAAIQAADGWLMSPALQTELGREATLRYQTLYCLRALLSRHAEQADVQERVGVFFPNNSRPEAFVQRTKNAMKEPFYHRVSSPLLRPLRTDVETNTDRGYAFLLLWALSRLATASPRHQAQCLENSEHLVELVLHEYTLTDYFNANWIEGVRDEDFRLLWGTNDAAFSSRMTYRAFEALCAYRQVLLRVGKRAEAERIGEEILRRVRALAYLRIKAKGCVTYEVQDHKPLNTAYYLASFLLVREQFPKHAWPEFPDLDVDAGKFESMLVDDLVLLLRQTFEGEFLGAPFVPDWEEAKGLPKGHSSYVEAAAVIGVVCLSAITLLRGRIELHSPPDLKGSTLVNCAKRAEQALSLVLSCQHLETGGFCWNNDVKNQAPTAYFTACATTFLDRYLRYAASDKAAIPLDSKDDPLSFGGSLSVTLTPDESQRLVRSIMGRSKDAIVESVLQGFPMNRMAVRRLVFMSMYCEEIGRGLTEDAFLALLADDALFRGSWEEFSTNVANRLAQKPARAVSLK